MTIASLFNLVYVLCDLLAVGFGARVLFWLLSGEVLHSCAVYFLRSVLAASIIGLFLTSHHFPTTQAVSMLSVYVSGLAILAWKKFRLVGIWYSIFALSITVILYLSVVVAIAQAFGVSSPFTVLVPVHANSQLALTQYIVIALFAGLGILAVKSRAKNGSYRRTKAEISEYLKR
jgi:hypothetical protein